MSPSFEWLKGRTHIGQLTDWPVSCNSGEAGRLPIFPDGRDIELVEDLIDLLGEEGAGSVLTPLWARPILKRDAHGIHGTLFYDNDDRRDHIPPSKREVDWDGGSVNQAQRNLFARHR